MSKLILCVMILGLGIWTGVYAQETLFYTQNFNTGTLPAGWSVSYESGGNRNWAVTNVPYEGDYSLYYNDSDYTFARAWAFTNALSLTAGYSYRVEFCQANSASVVNMMRVTAGTSQNAGSYLQDLSAASWASMANTSWVNRTSLEFTPTTSGNYYFGFNCYSPANRENVFIDNVRIYQKTNLTPAYPRHIAQWEPALGALVAYASNGGSYTGFPIPDAMLNDLTDDPDEQYLFVAVTSTNQAAAAVQLAAAGVPSSKIHYINPVRINTYWARDWGPISLYEGAVAGNRTLAMLDFDYNRHQRIEDNKLVLTIAEDLRAFLNTPLNSYYIPLSLTGGNIMTDGQYKQFRDNFVRLQNDGNLGTGQVTGSGLYFGEVYSYDAAQYASLVTQYAGMDPNNGNTLWNNPIVDDYIHHIDTWAKLVAVDRVIIADGMGGTTEANLDAIATQWAGMTASNGELFQVFRVNCTTSRIPYTNSFIMNGEVYMPFWSTLGNGAGTTPSASDTAARNVYLAALNGLTFNGNPFTVTGYYRRNESSNWVSTDAIHCRVNTIYLPTSDEEPPLPVELSSFTVTASSTNHAMLTWVTQSETNVAGFAIYRGQSDDLGQAIDLGVFVNATNTSQMQTYIYHDEETWESGTYYYWLESRDFDGSNQFYGPVNIVLEQNGPTTPPIPLVTGIDNVYPNPFNPSATIAFTLKETAQVEMLVYNTRGQLVKRLLLESKEPGQHEITWNGTDQEGRLCSSGIYNVLMRAGLQTFQRKAVLLK